MISKFYKCISIIVCLMIIFVLANSVANAALPKTHLGVTSMLRVKGSFGQQINEP